MRIVFMGTPQFSADILGEIARHHDVLRVYTQADKIRGRGKKLLASPVKALAQELGIEVSCPSTLRDADEIKSLSSLAPDVICVAAYGMILPKDVLDIPKFGCINVHASLLPKWRGAAPIERAIMAGDEYAGVCIMRMEEGLDTGDWCICRKIPIFGMSAQELTLELAELGSLALLAALEQISSGNVKWNAQDQSESTYAPKLEKRELWLDPAGEAKTQYRKFLASSENHPSKLSLNGKSCTLLRATLLENAQELIPESEMRTSSLVKIGKRLFLCFDDGAIEVLSLKPDGKASMDAASYLAGAHLPDHAEWSRAQ